MGQVTSAAADSRRQRSRAHITSRNIQRAPHTHASHLAMAATPMGVIAAQLGHVDTRMAEKHYAHLAPSYIADTIRANLPALGVVGEADSPEADQ
jgi:integrase